MDPNKIVRDQWLDDQDLSPYGMSGQKGYVHVVVYANGRKTIDAYKYGREGESQDPFKSVETVDQDVKKDFDNPPPTKNIGGQVMQFNPETGQYDKPLGAASAAGNTAGTASERTAKDIEPDPNNPGHFRRVIRTLNPDGSGKDVIGYEAVSDDEARKAGKLPEKPTVVNTNTTEQWIVKSDGTKELNPNYVPPKPAAPTTIPTNTTEPYIVQRNPDGTTSQVKNPNYKPETPLSGFNWDPQTHYGIVGESLAKQLQEILARTDIDNATKLKLAEITKGAHEVFFNESKDVLASQNTQRTQDITQRGQDMVQTAQRATLGNDIYQNAYKNSAAAAQYMPAGSDPGMGMIGQMLLNAGSIGAQGGSANAPQVPQGQAQQQLMGMGLPGMPSININLGGLTLPNNPTAQNVLDAAGKPGSPAPLAPTTETPPGTFPDQPTPEFANSLLGG